MLVIFKTLFVMIRLWWRVSRLRLLSASDLNHLCDTLICANLSLDLLIGNEIAGHIIGEMGAHAQIVGVCHFIILLNAN